MMPVEKKITNHLGSKEDYERLKKWIASFGNTALPFIDVRDFQARLAWMIFDKSRSNSHVERLTEEEQIRLDLSDQMLLNAIEEQGGAINRSGQYAVTDEVRAKLAEVNHIEGCPYLDSDCLDCDQRALSMGRTETEYYYFCYRLGREMRRPINWERRCECPLLDAHKS